MTQRLMVALIVILLALCGYLTLIHWHDDPHPLLIDAAADDRWCDFPQPRAPLLKPPGLYFGDGQLRPGEDGGTA